jgi:hypothetical protein
MVLRAAFSGSKSIQVGLSEARQKREAKLHIKTQNFTYFEEILRIDSFASLCSAFFTAFQSDN